jgi:CheY-like chemotaxis protein
MPYKLLLADDSVTIQRVIELTFADEDVKVTAVGDGQQAIDRILVERPDIVLADVGMPKRDGYEVAAFIKDDPALAHIPVLLLTGAFEPVDEERARSIRCNGVLAKPFEPQLLISRVKELLSGVVPSSDAQVAEQPPADQPAVVVVLQIEPDTGNAPLVAVEDASGSEFEEDATVRMPRPPMVPAENDLRLDVESLNLRSEPAPSADGSLDDYFDRLDAAFAHLTGAPSGREAATTSKAQGADPWAAAVRATHEWPAVPATPVGTDTGVVFPDFTREPGLDPDRVRPDVFGPGPAFGASSSPGDDLEAAASAAAPLATDAYAALPVSEAFAALLDAEREHGADVIHRHDAGAVVTVMLPGTVVTDTFVSDVARRVLERLGEPAFRDVVSQVVSATAERLVCEEIERLKASIR